MKNENVAVIILNYMSWEDTLSEAKIVHDMFGLGWNQIVIVDNNSPNESKNELEKKTIGDYVFIETYKNKGYASGNNVGLRYAYNNGFSYGWILNNDVIINDDSVLKKMIRVFSIDKDVAVVNTDVYSPEGYLYNRNSKKPNLYDSTIGMWSYRKKGRELKDVGGYGYIYRPQGCCMVLDLKKASEIDYLDENTFLYCEEPILAERLLKMNWKCACVTTASIIHNHSKTVKSVIGKWKTIKIQNKSTDYYLKKYRHYNIASRGLCIVFNTLKSIVIK